MVGRVVEVRERETWRRHQLSIQRSRAVAYGASAALGAALKLIGGLDFPWITIVVMLAIAVVSVAACRALVAHVAPLPAGKSWLERIFLAPTLPAWVVLDIATSTGAVWLSGGVHSPWYVLYMATVGGAGFVGGARTATVAAMFSSAAYLLLLSAMGHIGPDGSGLPEVLARLSLLMLGTFMVLLGALDMQRKRDLIKQLKEEEERKVAELTRLTEALDQRTRELADANLRFLEADRQKSQFLASMSHELRTPLNSIIGFSEVLNTRLGPTLEPKHQRFLQNIHTSGTHLLGLINDILDLTKIESGKMEMHPEKLQIQPLVEGVLALMRGQSARREIEIVADVPKDLPQIEADESRVKQILFNLLSNAVKFSSDGSKVLCTVRERPPGPDALLEQPSMAFEVRDYGIGIDPVDHLKVFQEFRQLDAGSSRKREGTGLGLALVKKFVELHGGTIRLRSRLGEGSTFTVLLPQARSPALAAAPQEPLPFPADDRPRILVVEDDLATWERIANDLEHAEFHAARARTGEEALVLARMMHPAAITLDLVLPGIDGWEVLRRLKADPDTREVPVIIVSVMEGRDLGVAMGADGYFVKPPDRAGLVGLIGQVVNRRNGLVEVRRV
jgi:signal transduction histidine kinase